MPFERFDACARFVGQLVRGRHEQIADGAFARAADATPELVELREPEHVGPVDEHRVGARNIEAALDDRGRAEDVVPPFDEVEHRLFERRVGHLPVSDRDARCRNELLEARGALVEPVDAVVDVEGLPASQSILAHDGAPDDALVVFRDDGPNGAPIDRRRRDDGHVAESPSTAILERAGNGRRREREHVDRRS